MLNWTQPGAGLLNAGITPQQLQSYYGNALTNYNYANQNKAAAPNPFGNVQTMRSNPFDTSSPMIARTGLGYDTPKTQAAAAQQNAQAAGQPITTLSGYMERQGLGNSSQIAGNIAKQGIAPFQNYLAPARDWELRETQRGNANGMMTSTFGKLMTTLGPALVTGGAALPLAGKMATGAAFGGITGGPLGALTGAAAAGLAPNIKLPGFKAAISAPAQAVKSVASQALQPTNLLRGVASQSVGAVAPRYSGYRLDPAALARAQNWLAGFR